MALVEINNLCAYLYTRHGVVKAVDGISMKIERGETLALVGESGSGKSMTLLAILGLLPWPTGKIVSGSIIFDNQDLTKKNAEEMRAIRGKRIAMIPQDPYTSLNPVFTIFDQMKEPLVHHLGITNSSELWKKTRELLNKVRIGDPDVRLRSYPHQMSGGMRQRVVGGIAISCMPEFLLADEPTTALDLSIQAQYLRLIKELQRENNSAMLYVSHDLAVVSRVSDRVAVMYAGKLVETGTVAEIFEHPLHPYTEALIKSIPPVDRDVDILLSLAGQPPKLFQLPKGCYFHPRCHMGKNDCQEAQPSVVEVTPGHVVTCWRYS